MELVAVFYHAWLSRQRCSDSIAGLGASGLGCRRSSCWGAGGYTSGFTVCFNAVRLIGVEAVAALVHTWVLRCCLVTGPMYERRWLYPAKEVREGGTELARYRLAVGF